MSTRAGVICTVARAAVLAALCLAGACRSNVPLLPNPTSDEPADVRWHVQVRRSGKQREFVAIHRYRDAVAQLVAVSPLGVRLFSIVREGDTEPAVEIGPLWDGFIAPRVLLAALQWTTYSCATLQSHGFAGTCTVDARSLHHRESKATINADGPGSTANIEMPGVTVTLRRLD